MPDTQSGIQAAVIAAIAAVITTLITNLVTANTEKDKAQKAHEATVEAARLAAVAQYNAGMRPSAPCVISGTLYDKTRGNVPLGDVQLWGWDNVLEHGAIFLASTGLDGSFEFPCNKSDRVYWTYRNGMYVETPEAARSAVSRKINLYIDPLRSTKADPSAVRQPKKLP